MAFIRIPSLSGRLYVPDACERRPAKRPCPDCFDCQQCSEARCGVCRGGCESPPPVPVPEKDP